MKCGEYAQRRAFYFIFIDESTTSQLKTLYHPDESFANYTARTFFSEFNIRLDLSCISSFLEQARVIEILAEQEFLFFFFHLCSHLYEHGLQRRNKKDQLRIKKN